MIRSVILSAALLAPFAVSAQQLPSAPFLPLGLAMTAAEAALRACAANGYNVSVAIVGRDGELKVLLKADNSGPHTGKSATGKAFTAAALGRDTAGLSDFIASNPSNEGMRYMDSRMVIQGGGVPVKIGDSLVAGIGVGGAPTGTIDAECAEAGIKALGSPAQ